jgi:rare lipoprotein A (peptidoglycan hydrolase)
MLRCAKATLLASLCLTAAAVPAPAWAGKSDPPATGGSLAAPGDEDPRSGSSSSPGSTTALATYYGPGLYGRRTACGTLLTPTTMGVAHRTLPCGTRLEVRYGQRRTVLTVIDRGPFSAGITWDLTSAAARLLGFPGRGPVSTVTLGRGPVPPV